MTHCGQPWIDEAISTMAHWENVYMSCCAVGPKYWREDFVYFINTRGKEKMMYGTEYPVTNWVKEQDFYEGIVATLERCVRPYRLRIHHH